MAILTGVYAPLSADERAALEAKIARNKQAFLDITAQLNADTPIDDLPDSVLLMIFRQYIADLKDRMIDTYFISTSVDEKATGHPYYSWIRITHVCRRWRDVALRTPALWTNIKVTGLESTEAFLERCGRAPLHVEGSIKAEWFDEPETEIKWRRIFSEAHRTASLHVALDCDFDTYPDDPGLGFPDFPILRSLWLLKKDFEARPALPRFIRDSQRYAGLDDFRAQWYRFSTIIPLAMDSLNLTRLSLSNFMDKSLTWPTLLETLGRFKSLQRLTLHRGLPKTKMGSPNGLPPAPPNPIVFPHMRELDLLCKVDGLSCAFLLQNISIPPDATIRMSLGSPRKADHPPRQQIRSPSNDRKFSSVAAPLISWLSDGEQLRGPPIHALQITSRVVDPKDGDPPMWIEVNAYPGAVCLYTAPEAARVQRRVIPDKPPRFETSWGAYSMDLILRQIPTLPSFRDMRCLILGDLRMTTNEPTPKDVDTWFEVFGHLTEIRLLHVSGRTSRHLPAALAARDRTPEVLFPKLVGLDLFRAVFKDLSRNTEEEQTEWFEALRKELDERKKRGLELQRLRIEDARNISRSMLGALKKLVEEMQWDGTSTEKKESAETDEWWADEAPELDPYYIADYPDIQHNELPPDFDIFGALGLVNPADNDDEDEDEDDE